MTGLRLATTGRRRSSPASCCFATLATAPARATTTDEIISRGKVIVAIDTTTAPYGMVDATMQPAGFDIEVANLVGKALGVPVEFVTVTSPGRIPSLLTNRVDMVISIFSITAGAGAAGRLQHPLRRAVLGGAGAEERRRSRGRRIWSGSRSGSPAAPARTAS